MSVPILERTDDIVRIRARRKELFAIMGSLCHDPDGLEALQDEMRALDAELTRKLRTLGNSRRPGRPAR